MTHYFVIEAFKSTSPNKKQFTTDEIYMAMLDAFLTVYINLKSLPNMHILFCL